MFEPILVWLTVNKIKRFVRLSEQNIVFAGAVGELRIGAKTLPGAVLEDGTRLLNQAGFLRTIGRARSPKAGSCVLSTVDNLPFVLQPFIFDEMMESTKPSLHTKNRLRLADLESSG